MLFMHTAVSAAAAASPTVADLHEHRDGPRDPQQSPYTVAVRALCEFTARRGDLDLRFTPSPTSQEGMAGHALVASRRPACYQTEISLAGSSAGSHGQLLVRGRADGFDPLLQQLEEIKTYRGDLAAMPANHRHLHWAQVRIYGWLMCRKLALGEIGLALVYFNIATGEETVIAERVGAEALKLFFEDHCERFLGWARQELAHRASRDDALKALAFPHPAFRTGQRALAEAVYRAAVRERCLMAQAPTGIGKTVATLFPMLKACGQGRLDKVYFLTAKASGRKLALDAVERIGAAPTTGHGRWPLRVLEMVARDKACEHPDKSCHGDSCPLARGFHDRLAGARSQALDCNRESGSSTITLLDRSAVRTVALAHGVCPYYLGQELARWCDVVVGDYNYYFDLNALLHGLALANQWRVGVLVDEAHNLIERARGMYSAALDQQHLRDLRQSAPAGLRQALARLGRAWNELHRDQVDAYQVYPSLPKKFLASLQQAAAAITDHLDGNPAQEGGELMRLYFAALHFLRLAESFGNHSIFDVSKPAVAGANGASGASGASGTRGASILCLRNVVPAVFVAPRLATAASAVLFSATLGPRHFYADTLGLAENTAWVDVASPFTAEQLAVHVVSRISTRYRDRDASIAPIADLMAHQFQRTPGNYLAFFSSFDYMKSVADWFAQRHPQIALRQQVRGMKEAEQVAYLARFQPASREIAFAVLGGSFAEAIDLPGDRLVGAFIATLGLPQVNPVNEQMKRRMHTCFGSGYEYAYLFPGMQKVVQAAGRVIRTLDDRGVIYLIDDRFSRPDVRRLLPAWWALQ